MTSTDYLVTPGQTMPSFHFRVGQDPLMSRDGRAGSAQRAPANEWGFPKPGFQSPNAKEAMASNYFVEDSVWDNIVDHGEFDDVIVGSGFCALAYATEALERDPMRKILILERGEFWLPEHFQNLPLPFKMVLGGRSETFPWTLSYKTYSNPEVKFLHGSCPFFGGRSTFWSAWCPQPSLELMRSFPKSLTEAADETFWKSAWGLLNVTSADQINQGAYNKLQKHIDNLLETGLDKIPTADLAEAATLAVGNPIPTAAIRFNKFSTPGPLLALQEKQRRLAKRGTGSPLMIATNVVARSLRVDEDNDNKVNILHTSRGDLCFPKGKTNVVLAAGAICNTTLLLNSLPKMQGRAGSRLTGHFVTHVVARFPLSSELHKELRADGIEVGASYVAGRDGENGLQYHLQITAMHSPNPKWDAEDAARECPSYNAAASEAQLTGSENSIVIVCSSLGELDEDNENSWVRRNAQSDDPTTNVKVQILLTEKDKHLWDVMDKATYDTITVMAGSGADQLEYWHNVGGWKKARPPVSAIRIPGVVHEASTLYVGEESDPQASVDSDYRPFGSNNLYVTGGALFPTAGSWNPTLTMCGYAQDLARKLVPIANTNHD